MSGRNRKRTFSLAGESFRRYYLSSRKKSFKHGGWSGIVLFVDTFTNEKSICRTMHLNRYLDNISFNTVKRGVYGVKPQMMAFDYIEIYYFEVEDFKKIRDYQNLFNREITKEKKTIPGQMEINFSAKKQRSNRHVK